MGLLLKDFTCLRSAVPGSLPNTLQAGTSKEGSKSEVDPLPEWSADLPALSWMATKESSLGSYSIEGQWVQF